MTTTPQQKVYPSYADHREAWEELAQGIASLRNKVSEVPEGSIPPNSKPGTLTIIGTGIETIGVSLGDKKIIEEADKILYCVADPATIVWLKRLRPDALDLYVLYGEDKIRYTTYMQMTEAQLYWVRQGLDVAVVFYGHPGIFVLSTHRAIKLARREGYRAVMKAGVCALDTLCADLGVDPCHPGLQTHEATDCLIRRRRIDPSLHVVLWQVGLIGEMGYRRHGYLNANFSYFINWLQEIYGEDYPITHYIGSRYPTIDPLIEIYPLSELHEPATQEKITGLSTFYIPPRDVVETDLQTVRDLGILKEGQRIVSPTSPLREIGRYGPRELTAFDAFADFSIPASYKWQEDTEASNFLIALRFDTRLQASYRDQPLMALEDERFQELSDRERSLLASRESGAIQIASKGNFRRDLPTEKLVSRLLNERVFTNDLLRTLKGKDKTSARAALQSWTDNRQLPFEWAYLARSVDYITRNNLYPWTGIYLAPDQNFLITLVGNRTDRKKSLLYINGTRIRRFKVLNGSLQWAAGKDIEQNGHLRFDTDQRARRRIVGKVWHSGEAATAQGFTATEVSPLITHLAPAAAPTINTKQVPPTGTFAIRTTGHFRNQVNTFRISPASLIINEQEITDWQFTDNQLCWHGGNGGVMTGKVHFLTDPIIGSLECYGHASSDANTPHDKCYGAGLPEGKFTYVGPELPEWAASHLVDIVTNHASRGGLLLWHKWEKHHFTARVVNKYLLRIL